MGKKFWTFLTFCCIWAIWPKSAYAIGFTIATAAGLTAATAAGGVGLTGLGLAVGGAITAGTIFGATKALGSAMKPPKSPDLPPLPKPPSLSDTGPGSPTAKAKAETTERRKAVARNKSIYTSPLGLTPLDKSELNLKTLTGA
jgi:hypothetical protein